MKVVFYFALVAGFYSCSGCSQAELAQFDASTPKRSLAQFVDSNYEIEKKLEAKEKKLLQMRAVISSLKSQIQKSNSSSSAMFFRELASREAEYRILEQDVYYLRQQAKK